jgi:hypothetical protein
VLVLESRLTGQVPVMEGAKGVLNYYEFTTLHHFGAVGFSSLCLEIM